MYSISNETLSIGVNSKGAELQSIYHLQNKLEYLWSGDAKFWPKKSPVLFPIVGGLKNNTYVYKGKTYNLSRHGFARDHEFGLTAHTEHSLTFSLKSNEETKLVYPFDFLFSVQYSLERNKVIVTFIVENSGESEMFFSVGAHPAFAVPLDKKLNYEDYYLRFNEVENADRWPLSADGLIENESVPLLRNENKLPLKKELFYKDALVLKELNSSSISIISDHSSYGVQVSFPGFPYTGIWAAKDADFVCIEPWCGIADSVNANGKPEDKEGMIQLATGNTFERSYSVEIF